MLSRDLKERVAFYIRENPGMSPETAMQKAQTDALVNNPFIPPTNGCPVNDLPPELLAHIFELGRQMYEEEEDYEDEDYDDDGLEDDEWETDDEEGDADEEVDGDADADVLMSSPVKRTAPLPPSGTDAEGSESSSNADSVGSAAEGDEPDLAFQVLVSHVCRHWRDIALGTHTLWTTVRFEGHLNAEKARAWIQRSNGLPLDIFIDCTTMHDPAHDHEGDEAAMQGPARAPAPATSALTSPCITLADLITIIDMLTPHVAHWRIFEVTVSYYTYMYEVLQRLSQCPSAPLLEELGLYDYEDSDEYEVFQPAELATPFTLFHGIAPKLTNVAFWGVHLAWDDSLVLLQGLREIELAYHALDVRPSFGAFRAMLAASPDLQLLSLCLSGPTGDMEVVEVPSLRTLVLCYLDSEYVQPLVRALVLPALEELTLDFSQEDYTDFAKQLAAPAQGQTRSLLAGLTGLKLTGLPCDKATSELVMAQLGQLKMLELNCAEEDDERWFQFLHRTNGKPPAPNAPMFCPKLETLRLTGIEGTLVRKLVAARKAAGAPLIKVSISDRDIVDEKDERWLRANLDAFSFFEPSDSEEDLAEVDEDDEEMIDD
ncbi:hypothetical protein B0H15DRAFT_774459 [Mycena belliarum]|uniref:F-box domain-containing protein n=1 Tax=Mycena belliarum TaxID=1033014 RepID=A0AAD6U9G2_9AGAR|nr:hypothetical protein B0H15DRAFT_774459 [Mycena belliae]